MRRAARFLLILLLFAACADRGLAAPRDPFLVHPDQIESVPVRFAPPRTERITLKNGIVLHFIENHELPLISLTAVFRAGSNYDPAGKEGLAELTAAVMRTGGVSGKTADALEDEMDLRAAAISITASMEFTSAQVSMHRKDAEQIMSFFSGMIREPFFDQDKMNTARNIMSESLTRTYDDPQKLAFREFRRVLYGDDSRGRLPTLSSLGGLKREDLVSFHRSYCFPRNMMIALSGDVTRAEAVSMVERWFGSWKGPAKRIAELPPPRNNPKGMVYFFNKKTPQSTVLLGHIVPGKESPDYYPVTVLDFMLGSGGFRSMISREIRNNRGLAYSAGSFYSARASFGVLNAYAMVACSSTTETLSLLRSILNSLRDHPVSEGELAWAKKSIGNQFIFSLESPGQIVYQKMMLEFESLPDDFLETFQGKIDRVRIQDIQAAADKYLIPGQARLLIVGDENGMATPLTSFGEVTRINWKKE